MNTDIRILCLLEKDFEDLELWYPILRLREEGASVDLAAPEKDKVYYGKYGVPAEATIALKGVDPDHYDGLLVPGGWAPDKLRRYDKVIEIVQAMDKARKPIGHICHAGWVLTSADIVKGRTVTSTPGIKDDMIHAGALWVDEPVVVDEHIVSSRRPPDLPAYMKAYIKQLYQK
ncbi:type 1 glutamine amidotransferase domain-containing protein [Fusibacter sp. JL216-2]|uniref:type 1 glutamine amidotransferase domain-containing protein n=1 Tax=Fusibacter sp. JL216-2 TaxID=3071453 RepID=UPI003D3558C3